MGEKIKNALGIRGTFKDTVMPMVYYNCTNVFMGGSSYIISMYFTIFLTDVVNMSLKQAGLVVMIATIWDAVTDPAMGIITDRTRNKRGKHRPYLIMGIPLMMISYVMMWNSYGFDASNSTLAMVYFVFAYMLFKTAYTVISIPHTAMLPELAPEYNLRTQFNSVGYIFNSVGLIPAYIFLLLMLKAYGSSGTLSSASRTPFFVAGIAQACYYGLGVFITYKFIKEPSSLKNQNEKLDLRYILREYVLVFKNKSFRQYFFMNAAYQFSAGFYSNSKVYYMKYLANQYNHYALYNALDVVGSTLAFPLNYMITIKHGKKRCGDIVTPLMFVGLAIGLFMQPSNGGKAAIFWVALMTASVILYQFGQSGLGYVCTNIFPDLTDVDELITGRRREGVIATFNTFIKKSISGVVAALVAFILQDFGLVTGDKVVEYEKQTGELFAQTNSAMWGVRVCVAVIPIVTAFAALYLMKKFQMTREDHTMIRAAVATRHKYGSVTLTDEQKERIEIVSGQKYENTWLGRDNDETEGHTLDMNEDGEYLILIEKEKEREEELAASNVK